MEYAQCGGKTYSWSCRRLTRVAALRDTLTALCLLSVMGSKGHVTALLTLSSERSQGEDLGLRRSFSSWCPSAGVVVLVLVVLVARPVLLCRRRTRVKEAPRCLSGAAVDVLVCGSPVLKVPLVWTWQKTKEDQRRLMPRCS